MRPLDKESIGHGVVASSIGRKIPKKRLRTVHTGSQRHDIRGGWEKGRDCCTKVSGQKTVEVTGTQNRNPSLLSESKSCESVPWSRGDAVSVLCSCIHYCRNPCICSSVKGTRPPMDQNLLVYLACILKTKTVGTFLLSTRVLRLSRPLLPFCWYNSKNFNSVQ